MPAVTKLWVVALCAALCTALWGSATPAIMVGGFDFIQG